MSIEVIKGELRALPTGERRKLMAFLVAIEDEEQLDYAKKLAHRIDDKSPGHWLSAEECERELGLSGGSK